MNETPQSKSKVSDELKAGDEENHDSSRVAFLDQNQESFVINRSRSPSPVREYDKNLKRTVSQTYEDSGHGAQNKRDSAVKSNKTQTIDNTEDIGIASGGLTSGQRYGEAIIDQQRKYLNSEVVVKEVGDAQ